MILRSMMQRDVHKKMNSGTARSSMGKLHCAGEGSGADGSPHASAFCACCISQLACILAILVPFLTQAGHGESGLAYILF